jgi:hypothetical protein
VLDSGYTNYMTGEKGYSHPFRKMIVKVIASCSTTIAKVKSLVSVRLLLQSNIQFLNFFLLNHWNTICYLFHNFMRWVTIACSLIRV